MKNVCSACEKKSIVLIEETEVPAVTAAGIFVRRTKQLLPTKGLPRPDFAEEV